MPSIFRATSVVYSDFVSVPRALFGLVIVAIVVTSATKLPILLFAPEGPSRSSAFTLLAAVSELGQYFLLAPVFIAIHRFIILGETTAQYAFSPPDLRFQRYFTCMAAFSVMTMAPQFVLEAHPTHPIIELVLVWILALMIAWLRLATLFPSIAVDASGVTIERALADSRGHTWRILLICVAALFPFILIGELAGYIVGALFGPVVKLVVSLGLGTLMMIQVVVIASRLYQWLGNKVTSAD